ncbi:MAG: hypothetical protein J6P44_02445 [Bacteroidales bacterium]|nr:hypothetical protein [Bacteroidales bacterium]
MGILIGMDGVIGRGKGNSNMYCGYEFDVTDSQCDVKRIAGAGKEYYFFAEGGGIFNGFKSCLVEGSGANIKKTYMPESSFAGFDLTGAKGNVMVEFPYLYARFETDGNKRRALFSLYPLPGFKPVKENTRINLGMYKATTKRTDSANDTTLCSVANPLYIGGDNNDTYRSKLYGRPITSVKIDDFRTYARKNGSDYGAIDWTGHNLMQHLYIAEYGNRNCQLAVNNQRDANGFRQGGLGSGVSNTISASWNTYNGYRPVAPCGAGNSLAGGSGEVEIWVLNDGTVQYTAPEEDLFLHTFIPKYHGIESPYGDIFELHDGVHILVKDASANGDVEFYVCNDHTKFASGITSDYELRGLIGNGTNYYYGDVLWGDKGDIIPLKSGGSDKTKWADYYYITNSNGANSRWCAVGGHANGGAHDGFGCVHANSVWTNTIVSCGSRLCLYENVTTNANGIIV